MLRFIFTLCLIAYPKVDESASDHYEIAPKISCKRLDALYVKALENLRKCEKSDKSECCGEQVELDEIIRQRLDCY